MVILTIVGLTLILISTGLLASDITISVWILGLPAFLGICIAFLGIGLNIRKGY